MFGFFIISSYTELFKNTTQSDYNFEYEYAYRSLQTAGKPSETERFNNGRFYPASDEAIEFYVIAVEPDSEFLTIRDGKSELLPNGQTNMTSALADRLGAKAGDTLSFVNKQDGREHSFHIDAIAASHVQGIYMPLADFNALLGYPDDSYIGLWSNASLDIPQRELAGAKVMSELSGSIDKMLGPLIGAMGAIIFVACIVALIILYIVTSLLIEENRRTISLFKVFGYKGREVKSLILNSSTFVVIFSFIISIPIVFAAMGTLYDYIGKMINIVLPKTINPMFILACFALILVTYQLSKAICARNVNSVSMGEALKAGSE
ncbi:FtsX-like permease family protein [Eubacteriales bacterium OttesenSCG-928-K08]|nr:FtsX-like permease family protein [Eubacteriales bacterium OttesenSCG-928-K08]